MRSMLQSSNRFFNNFVLSVLLLIIVRTKSMLYQVRLCPSPFILPLSQFFLLNLISYLFYSAYRRLISGHYSLT